MVLPFKLEPREQVIEEIQPLPALKISFFIKGFVILICITGVLSLALTGAQLQADPASGLFPTFMLFFTAFAAFSAIIIFIISDNEYANRGYWITNKRVVYKRGVLGYTEISVPLERVSDVIVSRTLFENLLGYGSVYVETETIPNSRRTFDACFEAVPDPEGVQEKILELAGAARKRKKA